jgi:hypothetical protein
MAKDKNFRVTSRPLSGSLLPVKNQMHQRAALLFILDFYFAIVVVHNELNGSQ